MMAVSAGKNSTAGTVRAARVPSGPSREAAVVEQPPPQIDFFDSDRILLLDYCRL